MKADNKKPHSGQPQGKEGHLLGANNGRCSCFQYTHPSRNLKPFNVDAYCRNADRAIANCFVMGLDFLSQIKFSYMIASNGKLVVRSARRAER